MRNKFNTILIAHRGESSLAPENTITAIRLAWQNNADGVEIDVQLTKDSEIVVIHDKNTKRISGIHKIVKTQLLEELKSLDVGKIESKNTGFEKIPTMDEVLDSIPDGKYVFIEIKCGSEIIESLVKILSETRMDHYRIKLMSFNLKVISKIKNLLPDYEAFWIKRSYKGNFIRSKTGLKKVIEKIKQHNLNGLNIQYGRFITPEYVKILKSENLKLFIWTVNEVGKAIKLVNLGVDGIISDRTGLLRNRLTE